MLHAWMTTLWTNNMSGMQCTAQYDCDYFALCKCGKILVCTCAQVTSSFSQCCMLKKKREGLAV